MVAVSEANEADKANKAIATDATNVTNKVDLANKADDATDTNYTDEADLTDEDGVLDNQLVELEKLDETDEAVKLNELVVAHKESSEMTQLSMKCVDS